MTTRDSLCKRGGQAGIAYLHGDFSAEERYAGAVANLLIYIVPFSQIYEGAKIQLSEKHMTFRYINYEGKICVDECEIRPNGEYIKVDDAKSLGRWPGHRTISLGSCAVRAAGRPYLRGRLSASNRERPLVTGVNGPLMAWRSGRLAILAS